LRKGDNCNNNSKENKELNDKEDSLTWELVLISDTNASGNLETIPIMISIEIPLPIPLSVILSPTTYRTSFLQ
jgi:hypothetical protein